MKAAIKRYDTAYKKRLDTDTDRNTFLPKRAPQEIVHCSGCGAFYHRRHWTLMAPPGFTNPVHTHAVYCPACVQVRQRLASGEFHLLNVAPADRGEMLRIMRNEEGRAREKNPLERIMSLQATGADWKIDTTTEKLAQRLGRAIAKARGGKVAYKWSHNNKFVRVEWRAKSAAK
jgi:hypothetical protein